MLPGTLDLASVGAGPHVGKQPGGPVRGARHDDAGQPSELSRAGKEPGYSHFAIRIDRNRFRIDIPGTSEGLHPSRGTGAIVPNDE